MRTDDPSLEESRKKALERVQKVNDMILTVLKNHLVVEQFMNEFLDASGKKIDDLKLREKSGSLQRAGTRRDRHGNLDSPEHSKQAAE